jgi:hypothetical protein
MKVGAGYAFFGTGTIAPQCDPLSTAAGCLRKLKRTGKEKKISKICLENLG